MSKLSEIKVGAVLESYSNQYAKVLAVEDGQVSISAWVYNKAQAEQDSIVATRLSLFGVAQALGVEEKDVKMAKSKEVVEEKVEEHQDKNTTTKELEQLSAEQLKTAMKDFGLEVTGKRDEYQLAFALYIQDEGLDVVKIVKQYLV